MTGGPSSPIGGGRERSSTSGVRSRRPGAERAASNLSSLGFALEVFCACALAHDSRISALPAAAAIPLLVFPADLGVTVRGSPASETLWRNSVRALHLTAAMLPAMVPPGYQPQVPGVDTRFLLAGVADHVIPGEIDAVCFFPDMPVRVTQAARLQISNSAVAVTVRFSGVQVTV